MSVAYVALGANLGDRVAMIESALRDLDDAGAVTAVSSLYETDPVGYADQPAYINAVAALKTTLSPEELLTILQAIEARHGRVRTFANAPRTLDLDLLLYDDVTLASDRLIVPHPRMHERAFVLVPLAEIAPDVEVPGSHASAAELRDRLDDRSGVRLFAPPPARHYANRYGS